MIEIQNTPTFPAKIIPFLLSALLLLVTLTPAYADFSDCQPIFYNHTAPAYANQADSYQMYPLCFHGFAVMYSANTRTPLWSAEHLTRERLFQADKLQREDNFHSERRLPNRIRSELEHYSGSGYDRGHLAPNADMANLNQQYDSFSLANITPQSPFLNRKIWKSIESATRYLTKVYGETYVVTGAVFSGEIQKIDNRVSIPSHLFKAVYIPELSQSGVYYATNDESGRVEVISINELTERTGINPMPSLDLTVTAVASKLPLPNEAFERLDNAEMDNRDDSVGSSEDASEQKTIENKNGLMAILSLIMTWVVELFSWIKEQLSQ